MILPSKTVKPVDSIFCIAPFILSLIKDKEINLDELMELVNKTYPNKVSLEKFLLCLNFLFIVGKLEVNNEIVKIKL